MKQQRGFTLVELMVVIAIITILASLMFGMSSRTYGANAQNVSDQIVATANLAKMRAASTRRQHLMVIQPNLITLWQAPTTGFATVSSGWVFVQQVTIPKSVTIWDVSSTVYAASGATVTKNASLNAQWTFKPDGATTGGTMFVTDYQHAKEYRVVVYRITGAAYARQTW